MYSYVVSKWFLRTTRNPHAIDRYTGGSSSGPAALVAAGLCSAAVGTDGGGSYKQNFRVCVLFWFGSYSADLFYFYDDRFS